MKINKLENIISSINEPQEKALVRRILDLAYRVEKTYSVAYTDFVDPFLLGKIKRHNLELLGINMIAYGGSVQAERQIMAVAHNDVEIDKEEFPIEYIHINVKTGIGKPVSHRDYLGSIMGLGIEREKIGDLLVQDNDAYVVVHREISDYIMYSLQTVSRYNNVTCNIITDIPTFSQNYTTINCTVSSTRMDAIIAAGFQISRTTAAKLIMAERALCNGIIVSQSASIKENDICTLRGYGKIKIVEIGSVTKKGRVRVKIDRYI